MVSAYAIPRYLLEVYKTDEEHFQQYVPNSANEYTGKEDSDEENNEGFTLHQGDIQEIYYYPELHSLSWDHDYENMENNGSCGIPFHATDLNQCYLGVRLCLRVDWEESNQKRVLKELPEAILGFITEQSFSGGLTNLSLAGMSKLLEQEYHFEFTQMKRSEIIIEMIKTAGLTADVDVTGLQDDVIDYSSGSDDGSSSTGGEGEDIDSLVKKIIKGKSGALEKAKAIHKYLVENLIYTGYSCSRYSTASECLKSKRLNCADTSRLTRAMMSSAGLNATVVHGPNHFWTVVTIKGKEYASDATSKYRAWNTVWQNMTYYNKCGDNPSC
ncbi:MAG: transglutaminase-like domain-containing protein [Methanobrevibacter sp.]|nr:transglutaminase-like domain-containing protein [Methanobrevibacter sp.]